MKEHEKIIINKMKAYAMQVLIFTEGMSFQEFSGDAKTIAACVFNLGQIGELVGKLSDEFTANNIQIPWRKIKGMRNRIIHDYDGIKLSIIWDVITEFLPQLTEDLDKTAL
jgi:uncharacterized protein with HEPN domain